MMTDATYLWKDTPAGVMCWHIHHDVLLEMSLEPLADRAVFIRKNKPPEEVEVRLRAMRPVVGALPEPVVQAAKAFAECHTAYNEAWKTLIQVWKAHGEAVKASTEAAKAYIEVTHAHDKAWKAYNEVQEAHRSELEALHAVECPDCPWDGETLFPSSTVKG